jgi:plastocyanin
LRAMALRGGLVAAAATALLVAPWAGPVQAGGGCHQGLTEGGGDTVEMSKMCFGPSILRVDPGTEVTFLNSDPLVHNVSANGWGQLEDMYQGDTFTATFRDNGIYPFACSYHAGMTGAVVVGDGTGAGTAASVMGPSAATAASIEERTTEARTTASSPTGGSTATTGWVAGGVLGLAVGAGLVLVWRRRSGGGVQP